MENRHDHFIQRARERFGLNFTEEDAQVLSQHESRIIEYQCGGRVVHGLEIGNQEVLVVFEGDEPVTALTFEMLQERRA